MHNSVETYLVKFKQICKEKYLQNYVVYLILYLSLYFWFIDLEKIY